MQAVIDEADREVERMLTPTVPDQPRPISDEVKCEWCDRTMSLCEGMAHEDDRLVYAREVTTGWARIPRDNDDNDAWDMYDGDNETMYLCDDCARAAMAGLAQMRESIRARVTIGRAAIPTPVLWANLTRGCLVW